MQFSGFWEPVELGWALLCSACHSIHSSDTDECRVKWPPPPATEGNGGEANRHLIMKFNTLNLKRTLSFG